MKRLATLESGNNAPGKGGRNFFAVLTLRAQIRGMLAVISLIVSTVAVTISVLAYFQARKTSSLPQRRKAINHVRIALADVTMQARIDSGTASSLRQAYQISLLVFSKKVSDMLGKLTETAFQLGHKPLEQKTDEDLDAERLLGDGLQNVLEQMQSETALNKWL